MLEIVQWVLAIFVGLFFVIFNRKAARSTVDWYARHTSYKTATEGEHRLMFILGGVLMICIGVLAMVDAIGEI